MKQIVFIFSSVSILLFSCNCCKDCKCPPCSAKDTSKISLFKALNGEDSFTLKEKGIKFITEPIEISSAITDINHFYDDLRGRTIEPRAFIDIRGLKDILDALENKGVDGIRLYMGEYTTTTARPADHNYINKPHLIFVPLDKNGNEIYSDGTGRTAIYNYNNDCPYNCPTNDGKSRLIENAKLETYRSMTP